MSRVQSDKRTFKMQTGCLSRQVVVATDGDLSRISRRISRAHSLGTMEAGRLSGWPRAKKKGKEPVYCVSAIPSAIPVLWQNRIRQTTRCWELHFRANMCNRGHAQRTYKSGSRMFSACAVLSVKVWECCLTVTGHIILQRAN